MFRKLHDFPESRVKRKAWDSYWASPCFSIAAMCEPSRATSEKVYGNSLMSSSFCPGDTADQCNPPSTVNSSDADVRMRACSGSENEICRIDSLIPGCAVHVSPPSTVVRSTPPVPAAYPNLESAKSMFKREPPSTVLCFTCQCAPLSDETAIDSSVPQIHRSPLALDIFNTRNGKSGLCEAGEN